MVHYKKLIYALRRYMDAEISPLFQGTLKGIALDFAGFVIEERGEKLFARYKNNPIIAGLGILDGENVDEELMLRYLRGKTQAGKWTLALPVIGSIDFGLQDVDTLARLIRE